MEEQIRAISHPVEDGAYAEGSVLWFVYNGEPDTQVAQAERDRSNQLVTVLGLEVNDSAGMPRVERGEAGMPFTYRLTFADGTEGTAFEDEVHEVQR